EVGVDAAEQERRAAVADDLNGLLEVITRGVEITLADRDVAEQEVSLRERLPLPRDAVLLQSPAQVIARELRLADRAINPPQHLVTRAQVFRVVALFGQRQRRFQIIDR